MLSIGKLSAGQAKYYLDQAEARVDVVDSIGDGVEEYYVGGASLAASGWALALASFGSVVPSMARRYVRCSPATTNTGGRSANRVCLSGSPAST